MGSKLTAAAIVYIGACILVSGYWVGTRLDAAINTVYMVEQAESVSSKSQDIMSLEEAAVYLGIGEGKLSELVQFSEHQGEAAIPHYKMDPANIMFSKRALDEWIVRIAEYKSKL